VEILEALVAQGRDVTALTNFNQDLFRITREAYPFLDLFRGITVSGEQRLVKPDPAIFAHHAEAFGLAAEATLFFDDSPPNIAAAEQAGWNAELFTNPEKMREDLERHGIGL
jgi:HAD superfamily hydrolase (TIGR01509 family)